MSEYFPEKLKTRPLISADKVLSLRCEKRPGHKSYLKFIAGLVS